MPRLTLDLTNEEETILKKRAKKNFLDLKEQAEDIIRRSCLSYKKRGRGVPKIKIDDKLVGIFSRDARGRKRK